MRPAEANLCRTRALQRKQEHDVLHEFQAAYQELAAAGRALALYRDRLEAAAVQLEARKELYRPGEMSVDLFLRAQFTYTDAEREEVLGVVRYNQAIAQWEFAKGATLDRSHVVFAEEIPRSPGEKADRAARPKPR